MKRSEIEFIIENDTLEYFFDNDPSKIEMCRFFAKSILEIIEEAGMLPPGNGKHYRDEESGFTTGVFRWDDEQSEEV